MPTDDDRNAFEEAIKNKNQEQIRALLQRDDVKELLLNKDDIGRLPIHDACTYELDKACLQLILDAGAQHGIAKEMLEENDTYGATCLHVACDNQLSTDSLRLLLEYVTEHADIKKVLEEKDNNGSTHLHLVCSKDLSPDFLLPLLEYLLKHADIKKVLEKKDNNGWTCLHFACFGKFSTQSLGILLCYLTKHADIMNVLEERTNLGWTCLHIACWKDLSPDSLRLLVSFFPSKDQCTRFLRRRAKNGTEEVKQFLDDSDCFEKCRLWLLRNHEDTFLYSLYPNSFDKTCQALKELKNGLQETPERLTIMLIALMSSPSKFREAVNKTDSSAPMASYFDVVKKGDKKSDYNHWRKNINRFRDFYGQWPPNQRNTSTTYEEGASACSCSIQ